MYKNPPAAPAAAKNFRVYFSRVRDSQRSAVGCTSMDKKSYSPPHIARKSYIPPLPSNTKVTSPPPLTFPAPPSRK